MWFYEADPKRQRYAYALRRYGEARELAIEEVSKMHQELGELRRQAFWVDVACWACMLGGSYLAGEALRHL